MTILQSFGIKILISRFLDMTILFNAKAHTCIKILVIFNVFF